MINEILNTLNELPYKVKRQLVIGWLRVLACILLLIFLSGGLIPTAWILLLRIVILWNALQAVPNSDVFGSFTNVLAQSLGFAVAWTLLIIVIRNEITIFNSVQNQLRMARLQATFPMGSPDVASTPSNSYGVRINSNEFDTPDEAAAFHDMQDGIVRLSAMDDDEQQLEESNISDSQEMMIEAPIFVYGDPFEGDLPEVFTYDRDLQQAVQDMRSSTKLPGRDKDLQQAVQDMRSTKKLSGKMDNTDQNLVIQPDAFPSVQRTDFSQAGLDAANQSFEQALRGLYTTDPYNADLNVANPASLDKEPTP